MINEKYDSLPHTARVIIAVIGLDRWVYEMPNPKNPSSRSATQTQIFKILEWLEVPKVEGHILQSLNELTEIGVLIRRKKNNLNEVFYELDTDITKEQIEHNLHSFLLMNQARNSND